MPSKEVETPSDHREQENCEDHLKLAGQSQPVDSRMPVSDLKTEGQGQCVKAERGSKSQQDLLDLQELLGAL